MILSRTAYHETNDSKTGKTFYQADLLLVRSLSYPLNKRKLKMLDSSIELIMILKIILKKNNSY